jgi:hypothetical protein
MIDTLHIWHELVRTRDATALDRVLHEDVVFHSPVVHTPQRGKAITTLYLRGALQVLNGEHFRYLREVVGARDAVLEFVTEIDGIQINGVDLIRWDDAGLIVDFKVMIRPLKAIDVVHRKMGELLQRLAPAGKP